MAAFGFFVLGFTAYVTALFGPALLGICFFHQAGRRLPRWLAHILYLPCALALAFGSGYLVFVAAHDDGNGLPGAGLALVPALAMLVGSIALYYAGVAGQLVMAALRFARRRWIKP